MEIRIQNNAKRSDFFFFFNVLTRQYFSNGILIYRDFDGPKGVGARASVLECGGAREQDGQLLQQ